MLTRFYRGKLGDDTDTIVPCLQGLATLVTFPQFTSSDALEVVEAFVPTTLAHLSHGSLIMIYQSVLPRQDEGLDRPSQIRSVLHSRHAGVQSP